MEMRALHKSTYVGGGVRNSLRSFSFTLKIRMPRRKKEDELPLDQRGPPRGAANLRERTRMRILSKAFGKLKLMLPWVPPDTKLSKLDTLRLATSYISHLQRILEENESDLEDTKFQNLVCIFQNENSLKHSVRPPNSWGRSCPSTGFENHPKCRI